MDGDRERWNAKWRVRAGELETAAAFLDAHAHLIPKRGKALDVACGAGRNAIWLARRGMDVTLVDVSDVALDKADQRARSAGLHARMRFLHLDLENELELAPLFDLVLICHFLDRKRRDHHVGLLRDDGTLIAAQPTVRNLERHTSPRREFLVELGELVQWTEQLGLTVLGSEEDWNEQGRHEAVVIAKRRSSAPAV